MNAPRILWDQLEWAGPAPDRSSGPVAFVVIAPWCPDCQDAGPRLQKALAKAAPKGVPTWLVGEFCEPEATRQFAAQHGLKWPILDGQREKSEPARQRARFRQLREAWGDTRRWGLPLLIVGRLENGWLIAERVQSEF